MKNVMNRLRRRSSRAEIVVVSGLPRSGTSLMMKMIAAGGITPLTDGLREADVDNPGGYFELENAKKLSSGETGWLTNAPGHAVKVIATLLPYLPSDYSYRVIFMRRPMAEVLASQKAMLVNRGQDPDAVPDDEMSRRFANHLDRIVPWLEEQSNYSTLYVGYNDLVANPTFEQVERIAEFLGRDLEILDMHAVIDPNLYRQRSQD